MLTVAIVGRANVGKSTLFNKLAGRRLALVHDEPGVTRDALKFQVELIGLMFELVDTAGIEPGKDDELTQRMGEGSVRAASEADVCLFLIDGRAGVTAADEIVAKDLRKSGKPVILVANKCESQAARLSANEAWSLGFGEPVMISAEHGIGYSDLVDELRPYAEKVEEHEATAAVEETAEKPLKIALIGRPNVGKSSLFNRLLGEERSLTGPEAGITRDAIVMPWQAGDRQVLLHDTAGLRRKARIDRGSVEKLSVGATMSAVKFCDCALVMMDATQAFEKQDLVITDLISREGRAVVFVLNKWDQVENKAGAISRWREKADESVPQITGAPLIAISAQTGEGLDRLLPAIQEADRAWNTRVPTAQLNKFLEAALARHAPPAIHGRRVRIRYMTQAKSRPPTFALFGNQLDALPEDYIRYLTRGLREAFDLHGTPIRFSRNTSENPYKGRRPKQTPRKSDKRR